MKRPVKAPRKNVASHEYDDQAQTLTVTFTSGKRYQYSNVPKDIASGFDGGSFLRREIIGRFPHKLLD